LKASYIADVSSQSDYREVWERTPDGRGRESGDPGFSSRNPAYAGPEGAVLDYVLENGQRDEYPAAWALPVATVERALAHFRETGERAPFVDWHED
jgi:hypothetical protein